MSLSSLCNFVLNFATSPSFEVSQQEKIDVDDIMLMMSVVYRRMLDT